MKRLFALVAAIALVDTMFYAAIVPLLPEYVDELGLSKSAAGVLTASYAAGTMLGSLPGGWLAARVGARPTVLAGLALMSLSGFAFAFAEDVVVLDLARFFQGVGGAFSWTGGLAWLISAAPADRRGELIGSWLAAAIAGMLLGPVLGGAATVVGSEPVFSAVAALGGVLAFWALRTPPAPPAPRQGAGVILREIARPAVVAGLWFVALPALLTGLLDVLAPLRLDELGASGLAIGAVFLAAAAVEAVLSRLAGRLSDRHGRLAPIRGGLLAAAVAAAVMPALGSVALVSAGVLAVVVALAFFWAPAMALLSDAAEAVGLAQGFAFALNNLAWAGGQLVGGSLGATLADATSDAVPYLAIAALLAASFALLSVAASRRMLTA